MINKKQLNIQLKFMEKNKIKYDKFELLIIDNDIELTVNNGVYTVLTLLAGFKGDLMQKAEELKKELNGILKEPIEIIQD